jgi:alpha-1,6-mannosyltransferase
MIDPYPRLVNIASMLRRKKLDFASGQGDAAVVLPRVGLSSTPLRTLRIRQALGPTHAAVALGVLAGAIVLIVLYASSAPSALVYVSNAEFPTWMAGPLHGLLSGLLQHSDVRPILPWKTVDYGFTVATVVMFIAWGITLAAARALSMRTIALTVAAIYAVLVLCPPLGLTDVFNYLGYARLGALHGLNPYTHVIADEHFDPVFYFGTWRHYHSPYGQVFTLLTYPLGWMSLSSAFWVLKVGMVMLMGAFVALVWKCARQLGYDPRFPVLFVALNPTILVSDVGGFHNDPVMLVPMMAAISLLLAGRYRWAGAALAVAVGVKPTIVLLLPFMMLAARPARRSLQVLLGAILGAIPLVAASIAAFGFSMPNVADQSIIVTPLSVVNLLGTALHLGGATPGVEQASKIALLLIVGGLVVMVLWRGRPDWLSGAGWATLALLACTAWLMPWYTVWALPLVALSRSRSLRIAMIAFIAFTAISFLPVIALLLRRYHINLMDTPADHLAVWRLWLFQH